MNAVVEPASGPLDPPSSRPRAGVLGGEVFSFAYRPADGVQRVSLTSPLQPVKSSPAPARPAETSLVTSFTELHWAFYADDEAALVPPWASLAVCPDVLFDDGSRLSDGIPGRGPAIDRYGFEVVPATQFAARWSMPQQWNADSVSLAPWAGRRIRAIELVLGDDSLAGGAVGGVSAGSTSEDGVHRGTSMGDTVCAPGSTSEDVARGFVEVLVRDTDTGSRGGDRPVQGDDAGAATASPAERVDTRRGTHAGPRFSRGNTIPAVAHPHGFVFVTPATDPTDTRWPYRWGVQDEPAGRRLAALQTSHQPSPWIGDHGVLQFVPCALEAPCAPCVPDAAGDAVVRGGRIVPGSEAARPHRYAATLAEGIEVVATATHSAVAVRVRGDGPVGLILDQPEGRGALRVSPLPDGRVEVEGWVAERADAAWGNAPRMYVAGETGGPATVVAGASADGLGTRLAASDALELRVATSFISIEQAHRTLALEAPWQRGLDDLIAEARGLWDALCGAIDLPPPPSDDRHALAHRELREKVAHALYRLRLYPNAAFENTGSTEAPEWRFADVFATVPSYGEEATRLPVVRGRLVVNNGYWDSYRTVWPLLALLDADATGALLDGQLEQVRRGGWTARWSGPGYIDCMVGTSSDQVYAQAARLGVSGFDRALAYESGWRNACEPSPDARTGRAGTASARFTGYVPSEIPGRARDDEDSAAGVHAGLAWMIEAATDDDEGSPAVIPADTGIPAGLSWTIEAAIGDAALARFAELLAGQASKGTSLTRLDSTPRAGVRPARSADVLRTRGLDGSALAADSSAHPARYRAHARYFGNRSLAYRQLFDPVSGFFRGRDRAGAFDGGNRVAPRERGFGVGAAPGVHPLGDFDPRVWGGDYVETNAWGMSVSAVHDGAGLTALFGGPAGLREHLDRLFAEPETIVAPYHPGVVVHEQAEARAVRAGMCALSNQPAHHIPFMYLHTDQPWRAAPLVNDLAKRLFTGGHIGQGFPGDEDNGELSAWWLWALLGLYPLDPGAAELVVGVPLVDDVTLRRDIGTLRVRVLRESPDACYVAAASWNGRPLERPVLTASELAEPGVLELQLVREPPADAPLWRTPEAVPAEWRPDLCRQEFAIASPGVDGRIAFDDGADPDAHCALAPGEWVGQDFGTPQQVTDLTLTAPGRTDPDAWAVEHSDDGLTWHESGTTHHEPLPPNRTTPFQLASPVTARHWRVRATTPTDLRQVELFDLP